MHLNLHKFCYVYFKMYYHAKNYKNDKEVFISKYGGL